MVNSDFQQCKSTSINNSNLGLIPTAFLRINQLAVNYIKNKNFVQKSYVFPYRENQHQNVSTIQTRTQLSKLQSLRSFGYKQRPNRFSPNHLTSSTIIVKFHSLTIYRHRIASYSTNTPAVSSPRRQMALAPSRSSNYSTPTKPPSYSCLTE